ncbi:hypothetical protein SaSA16_1458 [Streptococcus agalactiae]|nr:hypothetical protein SaSA16_1458 [Streptococcus agalactiae]AUP21832.1 hypothetical protein SaSA220_1460 [Streptococcus agalactiae]AUP33694.1 hypothetical protein SaSA343_1460 [Streptococcus agalactiae]AUP35396.1 hypothetical protein SaSA346_1459 [Streptococcus agalactiae]
MLIIEQLIHLLSTSTISTAGNLELEKQVTKREKILLLTSIDVNPVYANMAFDWVYDNYKDDIINYGQETIKNIGKSISTNNS